MNPKGIFGLAVVTLIVVAAAAVSVVRHYGNEEVAGTDRLLFPGLEDKVNGVEAIELSRGDEKLTLKRSGEAWSIVEKGDYPALADKARKAAIHVSQMRIIEAKTQRPALFGRLELEDPDAKGAKSTLLRLKDGKGQVLAELILGKTGFFLGGLGHTALYVRKPGENQAWKVKTGLDASIYALGWISKAIMDIPAKRVSRVVAEAADGSRLVAVKDAATDAHFRLDPAPPADVPLADNAQSRIDDMGTALAGLELTEVDKADAIDFSGEVTKAEVRTFDGLVVRAKLVEKAGWFWARFEASAAEGGAPASDDVVKEAAAINAHVGAWTFRMPDNKGRFLRTRLGDLKKKEGDGKSS